MAIRYVTYSGESVAEGASVALKNRLYVSGWNLSSMLKGMRRRKEGTIILAIKDGTPVGVAVRDAYDEVHCFVRKAQRGTGIGTKLIRRLDTGGEFRCYYGIVGSENFWAKFSNASYKG